MFDAVVSAFFRTVLDEACVDLPAHEAKKTPHIASQAIETTPKGELDADNLRAAGRQALLPAPSMWN
jgi:hypothetical protein